MNNIMKGMITAFSMYSVFPMPHIEWDKNTMKYALACFPFVGVVIGGAMFLLHTTLLYFKVSPLLYATLMVVLPFLLSGAIHLDGFIDTADARYSRQDLERKLEILKDPHVGAFGVIATSLLLLLEVGVYGQFYMDSQYILLLCLCPVATRCLSGLSIVSFQTAKNTGLAHMFAHNAEKKSVKIALAIESVIVISGMFFINLKMGVVLILVLLLWFFIYRRLSYKEFGGVTGDLAGFFLVIAEFLGVIVVTIGACI